MYAKKGSCSPARRKVSLDVAFMFLFIRNFSMNSWGIVGETLDKIIRCDGLTRSDWCSYS